MKYKIIADSSCDLNANYLKDTGIDFDLAPLTLNVNNKEFVDNESLDITEMLSCMHSFKGKSTSACPSPNDYEEKMTGADKYFIVTISSKLSGSHSAAVLAKNSFSNPDDVFVIDSKTVSGTMVLIIDKLVSLINSNIEYEKICEEILNYTENNISLLFILDKFDNLVKNGRVSATKGFIASTLSLKPICENKDGEIKIAKLALGHKRAIKELVEMLKTKTQDHSTKKCVLTHCFNEETAKWIKTELENRYNFKEIILMPMKGLCSFYALEKGLIFSYEK